jgi:two-component system chemotaxis response regulator CheY
MASILVVDDDPDILALIEDTLVAEGHTVVPAGDGAQALQLVTARRFDLVVTDIFMPKSDGLATAEAAAKAGTTVIAISGGGLQNGQSVLHVASSIGAVRILNKPFSMQTMVRTVNDVLRTPLHPRAERG